MQVVSAQPGFYGLEYFETEDGLDLDFSSSAIVAYCIDQSNPDRPDCIPVLLDSFAGGNALLRPDGHVEYVGTEYDSIAKWLEDMRSSHFNSKRQKLARQAKAAAAEKAK